MPVYFFGYGLLLIVPFGAIVEWRGSPALKKWFFGSATLLGGWLLLAALMAPFAAFLSIPVLPVLVVTTNLWLKEFASEKIKWINRSVCYSLLLILGLMVFLFYYLSTR